MEKMSTEDKEEIIKLKYNGYKIRFIQPLSLCNSKFIIEILNSEDKLIKNYEYTGEAVKDVCIFAESILEEKL